MLSRAIVAMVRMLHFHLNRTKKRSSAEMGLTSPLPPPLMFPSRSARISVEYAATKKVTEPASETTWQDSANILVDGPIDLGDTGFWNEHHIVRLQLQVGSPLEYFIEVELHHFGFVIAAVT